MSLSSTILNWTVHAGFNTSNCTGSYSLRRVYVYLICSIFNGTKILYPTFQGGNAFHGARNRPDFGILSGVDVARSVWIPFLRRLDSSSIWSIPLAIRDSINWRSSRDRNYFVFLNLNSTMVSLLLEIYNFLNSFSSFSWDILMGLSLQNSQSRWLNRTFVF